MELAEFLPYTKVMIMQNTNSEVKRQGHRDQWKFAPIWDFPDRISSLN